eukprot:1147463-Pelagomonas_calceolata.AAC.1
MLVEKVSPAADQPESQAIGQPLVTLCIAGTVQQAEQPEYLAEARPVTCNLSELRADVGAVGVLSGKKSHWAAPGE